MEDPSTPSSGTIAEHVRRPRNEWLYYDPDAHEYCASSSPLVGEIGWKLQLKEHAFYGALIPDMLFEHE
jgi:hypothetical protein